MTDDHMHHAIILYDRWNYSSSVHELTDHLIETMAVLAKKRN